MTAEDPFRMAFVFVAVVTVAVAAYHRVQAGKSGERLNRREEGLVILVSLRLAGLLLWAGALAYLIDPGWMAWSAVPLPSWVRWMGVVPGLACVMLLYWALKNLGKNLTDTVVTRAAHTLVTTGPYRWVRHPFYVAVGLLVLSAFLLTASGFVGLAGVLALVLLVVRTPIEERKLMERFGDEYRLYLARTGRFWPRARR